MALAIQLKVRMAGEKILDDTAVLLRFQAARAVSEDPLGLQLKRSAAQELKLFPPQALDFLLSNAPSQIDAPAHDTGVGTGDIH